MSDCPYCRHHASPYPKGFHHASKCPEKRRRFVCPEHGTLTLTERKGEVSVYTCPKCALIITTEPVR